MLTPECTSHDLDQNYRVLVYKWIGCLLVLDIPVLWGLYLLIWISHR